MAGESLRKADAHGLLQALAARTRQAGDRVADFLQMSLPWWLVVAGGAAARLWQYAENPSLVHDEASLAINIARTSFAGMLGPLPLNTSSTVAPILFMWIEKLAIMALGNKDYVLRLFPLMAGLAALVLLYRVAKHELGAAGLFALVALGVSASDRYYSTLAKQYGTDATLALLLVYLAAPLLDGKLTTRRVVLLGLVGAAAIWISHPAIFVLAAIGAFMLYGALRGKDRGAFVATALLGAGWLLAFGASYLVSLHTLVGNAYLSGYWQAGFMPLPPWANPGWPWSTYQSLLQMMTPSSSLAVALAWLALILLGGYSLLARRRKLGWLIVLMIVAALAASALRKYPLREKFLLFLIPFVYLLVAEGLASIFRFLGRWNREAAGVLYAAMALALLWPALVTLKREVVNPRLPAENMRPIVQYMAAHAQPTDVVLVSGGGASYPYYAGSYGLKFAQTKIADSHRIIRYFQYRKMLANLAGKERVWVVFAHFEEGSYLYNRYPKYLNRVGEIQDVAKFGQARVYLCRLDP